MYFCNAVVAYADYQQGLDAYLKGDFQNAQDLWKQAAQGEDARSMFNLGLLHQQEKISDASLEQAIKWYERAVEHGYLPAAYHLGALMIEQGSGDGLRWVEKASQEGYLPAQRYLARTGVLTTDVASAVPRESSSDVSQANKPSIRSEAWITKQQSNGWTIQLRAFKELSEVEAFVAEHNLYQSAAFFREASRDVVFYKVMYGYYVSKDAAEKAREALSSELQSHGPWLRRIEEVKASIAKSEK